MLRSYFAPLPCTHLTR